MAPAALMQIQDRGLDEQIALANRVQSSKVNSLMKSIDKLQKENISLQRKSLESNRTAQYKKIQDELGQQDVMIDVLRSCIGIEQAQKLMTNAIEAPEAKQIACSSCDCEEELFASSEGSWLCKRCYSQQCWKEPPKDARTQLSKCPKYPDSKEQLQKECAALEAELTSTKHFLKQRPPRSTLPEQSVSLNTVAALSNLLAGYVQRADQLEKENASLKNHQEQLEETVKEQEEQHRQQIQDQLALFPTEQGKCTAEDLESRIRLRNSEIDRLVRALDELQSEIVTQKSKHESLKKEHESARDDLRKLQQDMSAWSSEEAAEHAKQLDKLRQSKEHGKQLLKNGREQLQDVKTKLRKSLQSIGDQRAPLEVQTKIKGQAQRLHSTLRDVHDALSKRSAWSNFSSQLDIEKALGLEGAVQQILQRYETEIQGSEPPTVERLQELKQDLYSLETNSTGKEIPANRCDWNVAKMQEDFRAKLDPQLASLSKLETMLHTEQQVLDNLVAEARLESNI